MVGCEREVEGISKRDVRFCANFVKKNPSYSSVWLMSFSLADGFFTPFRKKKERLTFSGKSPWNLL